MVFHKIRVRKKDICFDFKEYVLGAWLVNPYISFGASAIVEIFAYVIVYLVLHRWGRKVTYCSFVIGFAVIAFLVVPIQTLMIKDSRGINLMKNFPIYVLFTFRRSIQSYVYG